MDLTNNNIQQHHHQHQQQLQLQLQHPFNTSTTSSQIIATPGGQLPDENYIEKLFPKCQPPKYQQNKSTTNNRAASSTSNLMNGSSRQPQRRQNRAKMQQQHHQQQRKMETLDDDNSSVRRKDKSIQKSHSLFNDLSTGGGGGDGNKKINDADYCNSSSGSSDNLSTPRAGMKGDKNYGGGGSVQRKNSNHFKTTDDNESHQVGVESQRLPNRQRARRYKATKNLQPRFRRTQSNQSKSSAQSIEPKSQNDDEKSSLAATDKLAFPLSSSSIAAPSSSNLIAASSPPAATASASAAAVTSSTSIPINLNSNPGLSTSRVPPTSEPITIPIDPTNRPKINDNTIRRKSEGKTISRTCRGIVFSESLQTFNSDDLVSDQLVTPTATAAFIAHDEDVAAAAQSPLLMDPIAQQTSLIPSTPPRQVVAADAKSGEVGANADRPIRAKSPETAITTANATSFGFYDSSPEHSRQTSYTTKDNELIETKLLLHEEDHLKEDDRYINLFVYDNTGPHQRKIEDAEELSGDLNQNYNELTDKSQEHQPPLIDQRAGHKFFAEDLNDNELDVIKNDTSIEELCNFEDEDINNSVQFEKIVRASVNDTTSEDTPEISDFATSKLSASSKSHSKHRLLGTLQTVDEKAEINVDNGIHSAISVGSDTSKTELIDIGDSSAMPSEDGLKMVRRGGPAPPGFPRRVRPNHQQQQNHQMQQPQLQKPQDSSSNKNNETQTARDQSLDSIKSSSNADFRTDQVVPASHNSMTNPESARSRTLISPLTDDQAKTIETSLVEFLKPEESEHDSGQGYIDEQLSETLGKVSLTSKVPELETSESGQTVNPSQHHKLPNETSHYSILHSINRVQTSQPDTSEVLRSRIQFNTLSDADDSEIDDKPNVIARTNKAETSRSTMDDKKLDRLQANYSSTTDLKDDDLVPANKTALIFPRLDEGLSSDAESCADDVDEDDERAIEADVDADDEEGNEDDADSPIRTNGRGSGSGLLGSDNFLRQQPQSSSASSSSSRLQGRFLGGSVHQIPASTNMSTMQASDIDAQQIKQNSNSQQYSNFIGTNETLDQNEHLKSLPGYPNHNGQSNYWTMGVASQTPLSTQPSSVHNQQQFPLQRNQQLSNTNNGNNNNLSRSNSYINRDEAKAVNRLSSDTDNETDRLLGSQRNDQLQKIQSNSGSSSNNNNSSNNSSNNNNNNDLVGSNSTTDNQIANSFGTKQSTNSKEVLIEGVLFNVKYLGSTHTECEGRGEKEDRIHQAELAVHEVKFRDGDPQTPVEVQLFISTEKIMVLDDKHRKIMMDHSLRTISYIADIGDAIVLIVRKKSTSMDMANEIGRPISKTSCHVFESNESHTITKSISQAFQVAYTELLKANGAADANSYLPKELDYQEVLNSQEMSTTELEMFARKDNQREVIVPKQKGEILGLSIVESGWGSVLPTAVIASLKQDGPAYRCKKLSVGDQILSINGISLVGLSLAECQKILRKTKNQSVARLSVVPCPITVEVKIKRPDTKYQLGFSVQHGVICSLLRGGIAERGGVRVGHRIISINGTTVVGVPHDKIVTLLASSVGEIRMKTCLTSLYRHMLGEEKNVSFV